MKIINKTKKTLITNDAKLLTSLIDKSLGLLNPKNPRTIIFKTRWGIHTFFLKEPIDIIILNNQNQVVILKQSLKPNRFYFWNPKHELIIELPKRSITKSNTKIGDLIQTNYL